MTSLETRIPPPLVAIVCAGLMSLVAQWITAPVLSLPASLRGLLIAALLCVAGFFALSAALRFKRSATTIDPRKPDTTHALVTEGVYRWTRNPMYLGMALVLAAWGVYLLSVWSLLGVVVFVTYLNRFQIGPEERALRALFGAEFDTYCATVRRWI